MLVLVVIMLYYNIFSSNNKTSDYYLFMNSGVGPILPDNFIETH